MNWIVSYKTLEPFNSRIGQFGGTYVFQTKKEVFAFVAKVMSIAPELKADISKEQK